MSSRYRPPPNSKRITYTDDLDEQTAALLDAVDPLQDNPCQLSDRDMTDARKDDGEGEGRPPCTDEHFKLKHGPRY